MVIDGADLIGSHVVDDLIKKEVEEIIIYDNFSEAVWLTLSLN